MNRFVNTLGIVNIISIKYYRLIIFTKEYEYCCYNTVLSLFCFCTVDDLFFYFIFFFHMTNQQKLFDSTKKYVCRRMNSFSTTIVYRITVFFVPVKWFCKLERIFDWRIKTLSTNTSVTFIAADDTSYLFDSSLAQGDEFVLKDKHPSDTPPLLISFLNLPRR